MSEPSSWVTTDRLHLADAARSVVRQASEQRSLTHVLETAQPALLEALHARGAWIQTFDEDGLGRGTVYSADGRDVVITETVYAIAYNTAHLLWEHQDTVVLSRRRHSRVLSRTESRDVATFLEELDVDSVLFVPVGAGHECLGNLVLTREADSPEWNDDEAAAALEIGRDLGVAIHSVRAHEREQRLVAELHAVETRLTQLLAGTDTGRVDIDPEPSGAADVDEARVALRAAADYLEQTGRRRDAQARLVADALSIGQVAQRGAVDDYRALTEQHRAAHLAWQAAFDAWQDLSGGTTA